MARSTFEDDMASEIRSEHCKVYIEPTLKKAIKDLATQEGITFSEAGRKLWLLALRLSVVSQDEGNRE